MYRFARRGLYLVALLVLGALSACAPSAAGTAAAPTTTPTVPGTSAGWSVYRGAHFTIAYPGGWSYTTTSGGVGQTIVKLVGPQSRDQIIIIETTGVPQDQAASDCHVAGATQTKLAGLTMSYQVAEGVHRTWSFLTSAHTSYALNTLDADQPAATQARHDAILATFRPDVTTSGCP